MTVHLKNNPYADESQKQYTETRIKHWEKIILDESSRRGLGKYYQKRLAEIYQFSIPPQSRVLEIGSGEGDLLKALNPSYGVGIDFSPEMITKAKDKHPGIRFEICDAHNLNLNETFDFIILSDLVNDLWDVQRVFEEIKKVSHRQTRIILNFYSRIWEKPLSLAKALKLARPTLPQNWLTQEDLRNLLSLAGFEVIRSSQEILCPFPIPLLSAFLNRYLVKIFPFNSLALTNFIIAKPNSSLESTADNSQQISVSVIVPARNEAGNMREIFERTPQMGKGTELIFVEGHSSDDTYGTIEKLIPEFPGQKSALFRQPGKGKGDAVRHGFSKASGEILMILDADITVVPEDLEKFYTILSSGKADFVNGVRLVYPMEKQAMRFLNLLANKFFSFAFSWLLGQHIKDTLCGTKVLRKEDYLKILENRKYFGDFDPFGDFDLIFGAAKLNLKMVDLPIRYRERKYGTTNIQRWKHGWLLLRMVFFAARKIKFI
ncbi:MAG: glycosyltransferase [Candidatus Omnitrophica bacterium]|nr:glycosyltransferase [Candidatus Omnitrophota bacterium]